MINRPGYDWLLALTSRDTKVPLGLHPTLDANQDINEQERRLLIREGTPILISPDLAIDARLVDYFARSGFASRAMSGKETVARELKTWLAFLDSRERGWDEAVEQDYDDYKAWRTEPDLHVGLDEDPDAAVVTGATFDKGRWAIEGFYRWAVRRGHVEANPVPPTRAPGRARRQAGSNNARFDRAKWVTPETYVTWRDVGLAGHTLRRQGRGVVPGPPDPKWRGGLMCQRNVAFTNLMVTTALRRREQTSLLIPELPTQFTDVRLSSAVAKYNKSRAYSPVPEVVDQVFAYVTDSRARAVRCAQRAGRYETHAVRRELVMVEEVVADPRNGLLAKLETGRMIRFDDLSAQRRMLMFSRDEEGQLAPLALWLQDDGLPMSAHGWNKALDSANARVRREYVRLGLPERQSIALSPHSLRYSFALYVLTVLHMKIDEREGRSSDTPYDVRRYETAYDIVRDLLGHASVDTTKKIYLEPVQGIRRAALFQGRDFLSILGGLAASAEALIDSRTIFGLNA